MTPYWSCRSLMTTTHITQIPPDPSTCPTPCYVAVYTHFAASAAPSLPPVLHAACSPPHMQSNSTLLALNARACGGQACNAHRLRIRRTLSWLTLHAGRHPDVGGIVHCMHMHYQHSVGARHAGCLGLGRVLSCTHSTAAPSPAQLWLFCGLALCALVLASGPVGVHACCKQGDFLE